MRVIFLVIIFLNSHHGLIRHDFHINNIWIFVGRNHKLVAIVLIRGFHRVEVGRADKLILCVVVVLLFCILTISLEDTDVLRLNAWDFRVVEALASHFWLVEGNSPEEDRGTKNLSQIIGPK